MPFAAYNASGDSEYVRFWELVNALQAVNGTGPGSWGWANGHCLPWEWASLCALLYDANAAVDGDQLPRSVREAFVQDGLAEVNTPEPARTWYPVECYPVDYHRRTQLTADDWRSLMVRSPDELRQAASEHRVPRNIAAEQEQLALWIITRVICEKKSLDGTVLYRA